MQKEVKIGNKIVGEKQPCFIIAEAGVNHNGSFDLAKLLIDEAVKAGADAVKFQFYETSKIVTEKAEMAEYQKKNLGKEESQAAMLKKLEMGEKEHKNLREYAKEKKIIFMSTPHSGNDAVDVLERVGVPAYKIGSGDLNNKPFLEYVAKTKKPIILATGMGTMNDVKKAIKWIKDKGNNNIIVLHCTTNYPTPYDEVNMNAMKTMMDELDCLVGYSDHTLGTEIPILARALGACVIEKHFTLDKTMDGPDHKASVEPNELAFIVKSIRNVEAALGSFEKKPNKSEEKMMEAGRKSLVAARDIKKGRVISSDDITIKRPGTGLAPEKYDSVIGKKAKKDIEQDTLLKEGDF